MDIKKSTVEKSGYKLGQFVAKVYLAVGSACILSIIVALTVKLLRWILL